MDKGIESILGKTLSRVSVDRDNNQILFETVDGKTFKMYHDQDCCEHVYIEDITGDVQDLISSPILEAEEVTNEDNPLIEDDYIPESFTWTFYKIRTIKGGVTIRWYGTSNGYYSERVDFEEVETN